MRLIKNPELIYQRRIDDMFEVLEKTYPNKSDFISQLKDFVNKWVEYLETRKQENTILTYISHLEYILTYILSNDLDLNLSIKEAEDFYTSLNLKIVSKNTALYSASSFYDFLYRQNIVPSNPFKSVEVKSPPETLPKPLTKEDYINIYKSIDKIFWLGQGFLDKHFIPFLILMNSGIRVSELMNLRVSHFPESFDTKFLSFRVLGKGRKERTAIIINVYDAFSVEHFKYLPQRFQSYKTTDLSGIIWWYVLKLREYNETEPIYPDSRANLHKLLLKIKKRLKEDFKYNETKLKGITLHSFRHSFATYLIKKGISLPEVQMLLGHKSPITTMKYVKIEMPDILKKLGG